MVILNIILKNHINDRDKNTHFIYWKILKSIYQNSCAYKLVFMDDKFTKPVVLYRETNEIYKLTESILEKLIIANKW